MEVKAFPGIPTFDQDANRTVWQEGMNLRDWFAGMAMQGLVTQQDWFNADWHLEAGAAYEIADKMMEARNGNEE
jgi:hypothetical protein